MVWKVFDIRRSNVLAILAVTLDTTGINGPRIYTVNKRTTSRRLILVVVTQKMVEDLYLTVNMIVVVVVVVIIIITTTTTNINMQSLNCSCNVCIGLNIFVYS